MNNISPSEPSKGTYSYDKLHKKGNPWLPSFFRRAPWLGLASMLGALLGVLASAIVLYVSNGKPVHDWTVQPTVYLAIASTTTNILLHFALNEALTVAWWKRALQKDTTIADLHRNWKHGRYLGSALKSGRHFSVIALATILVAFVSINGPLLQRASQVRQGRFTRDSDVRVSIASKIPNGFTGYLSSRGHVPTLLSPPFVEVVQAFNRKAPILVPDSGCIGSCNARIIGAGLVPNCSSSTSPYFFQTDNETLAEKYIINGTTIFGTYFQFGDLYWSMNNQGPDAEEGTEDLTGSFDIGLQFKDTADCNGALVTRNCSLRPAIVSYPVIIDGDRSTVSLAADTTIYDDKMLNYTNINTSFIDTTASWNISTYGGFFKTMQDSYQSTMDMLFNAIGYEIYTEGSLSSTYVNTASNLTLLDCTLFFRDPTDDILAAVRDLMFRTALASANTSTTPAAQNVTAQESFDTPIYTSSYFFLSLAGLFSLLGWFATIPIFLGWWHLGRTVSLSPVETAKAFAAPGLVTSDSNLDADGILKEVGEREVRYGAMLGTGMGVKGGKPREEGGMRFRLVIGEAEGVRSPRVGERFD